MPGAILLILLGLMVATGKAEEAGIPRQEYAARRAALARLAQGAVMVLFGADSPAMGNLRTGFLQEPNFRYLTGWEEPGAVLVLAEKAAGEGNGAIEEVLLLPQRNAEVEKWTGRKWAAGDAGAREAAGVARVEAREQLAALLKRVARASRPILTLGATPGAQGMAELAPGRAVGDAGELLAAMRMRKSAREIEAIRRAVGVTVEAQLAAWKRVRPRVWEYQVAATLVGHYLERGCEGPAFRPVVASGANATVLHATGHRSRLQAGELIVIDTGAECGGYVADLTRTLPVSGRFSQRQREVYDAVLRAQQAVIAAVKPGMTLGREEDKGLYRLAQRELERSGVRAAGKPLSEYFTHGIGHHVGLEVHDAALDVPLEAGMVIAVEPGVYLPEENLGVRIEDMVLVTESGGVLLSGALPREVAAVEKALRR